MSLHRTYSQFAARGSNAQAIEAVRFLQRHNMIERDELTGQVESETAPSSPPHRYLAEEYDFSNCCFLITDGCNIDD